MDGIVYLWSVKNTENKNKFDIKNLYVYELNNKDEPTTSNLSLSNHVQSICIGKKSILAGLKSGDIYELTLPAEKFNESKFLIVANNNLVPAKLKLNA